MGTKVERVYAIIGDKIARARIERNLTQAELCDFLRPDIELQRTSITHIERGKQRMMLHDIIIIFEKLNIELNFDLTLKEIEKMNKTYMYHKPSTEGLEKIKVLREKFSELHGIVDITAPHSRERSVAFTALEEAAMWAIKAVVVNDPESTTE